MPSAIKAFIASVGLLLVMMWLFSSEMNPFTVADHPISIVVFLIAFGLTRDMGSDTIYPRPEHFPNPWQPAWNLANWRVGQ